MSALLVCPVCGTEFTPVNGQQLYDGDRCKKRAYRLRHGLQARPLRTYACERCGARRTTSDPRAKFCSRSCASKRRGERRRNRPQAGCGRNRPQAGCGPCEVVGCSRTCNDGGRWCRYHTEKMVVAPPPPPKAPSPPPDEPDAVWTLVVHSKEAQFSSHSSRAAAEAAGVETGTTFDVVAPIRRKRTRPTVEQVLRYGRGICDPQPDTPVRRTL